MRDFGHRWDVEGREKEKRRDERIGGWGDLGRGGGDEGEGRI